MPNKVENNDIAQQEKVYYNVDNLQGEMLRYKSNSLSYKLGMLAILMSIMAAFISLNSVAWNFVVIIKILMNIVILLFGFLSIEKVKSYSKEYSFVLIGMGAVCVLRIFWYPLLIMIDYGKYLQDSTNTGILGPTVTGTYLQNSYLPMSGYFRGIAAIIFLGLAAAAFIASGIVGLIKAKQYSEFMATQDVTKGV